MFPLHHLTIAASVFILYSVLVRVCDTQGIKAELELEDSALESYYANAKFQSDCGDYVRAAAALKSYCEITQTPGVPGSGPNGMGALWGRLACEVCAGREGTAMHACDALA